MKGIIEQIQNPSQYKPGSLTLEDVGNIFGKSEQPIHWGERDSKFIYHKTIGFPETIVVPDNIFNLGYTTHAKERAKQRVNGLMLVPTFVRMTDANLIEVHTDDNKVIKKAVVKLHYDKKRDIILVMEIQYERRKAVVITLYYNKKNHSFDTLDKTKYNVPEQRTGLCDVQRGDGELPSDNDKGTGSEP